MPSPKVLLGYRKSLPYVMRFIEKIGHEKVLYDSDMFGKHLSMNWKKFSAIEDDKKERILFKIQKD